MAQRRTIDLLPEIFRTPTNRKFLSATLDQLTQEPNVTRTQGYVGRRVGPGVDPSDSYVTEPTATRANYQLEPSIAFLKPETSLAQDAITYPGLLDAFQLQGAKTTQADRLFESEYYAWDSFCDLDKFINYSQYYWLPQGPDSVEVKTAESPLKYNFTVARNPVQGYQLTGQFGDNPKIVLTRGGNYTFQVGQPGHSFWIQTDPGINGRLPSTPNVSSRDVLGVINNGSSDGTVTFNVPQATAQNFYHTLSSVGTADLVTTLRFDQLNNVYVDVFLEQFPNGIDELIDLNNRTVIFINPISDAVDGGWLNNSQFDPLGRDNDNNGLVGSFDTTLFDQTQEINNLDTRYSVWQIRYVSDSTGRAYMQLSSITPVPENSKVSIQYGRQYSSTSWFRNANGVFEQVPLLTSAVSTLYYQDSTDPNLFGTIQIIDPEAAVPLIVDEIIGAKEYVSPTGIRFTNGLKVQFSGDVEPVSFANQEFYVEGVGSGPGAQFRAGYINGEAYFGPYYDDQDDVRLSGYADEVDTIKLVVYETVEQSLANPGAAAPGNNDAVPVRSIPGAVDGNGIRLIPVNSLITPEQYIADENQFATGPQDIPTVPDYVTINRGGRDLNAWSRSNRWFHIDVIKYTAALNEQTAVLDNNSRGKRPIIEFRSGLELYNWGTQGKTSVDVIDFQQTDALSNINGKLGYAVDGVLFYTGMRIVFAADRDIQVRNKIYQVNFIDTDGNGFNFVIDLVPIQNATALIGETTVCTKGITLKGLEFWFDGDEWSRGQQKTSVNQAPLFDIQDGQGRSFGDRRFYPSSTFDGSQLFGYARPGTGIVDPVLGFPLAYYNITNVGDIVFENYLYTDTFDYVDQDKGTSVSVSTGFARQYLDRINFSSQIGWVPAASPVRPRQVFRFVFDAVSLIMDVPVNVNDILPPLQIFVDSKFVDPTDYKITVTGRNTVVIFVNPPPAGTIIEVQALSSEVSAVAYYQVPLNLENNALNKNSTRFTLGTIRNHYETIGQNLKVLRGPVIGANNTRDLGNVLQYGDNIVQHSAPLSLTGTFMREQQYELFNAIDFNSKEYQKYKARLLELAAQGDYINLTPTQILDVVLQELTLGRSESTPFYWSDMIPAGETFTTLQYTITPISTRFFDTTQTYNFAGANYRGILIYYNNRLLVKDVDYIVENNLPVVELLIPTAVGDRITIREYASTYGTFVPNTPSKMGMYPVWRPAMFLDNTYVRPTTVIQGHDGSITVAYGDARDEILLEFETRIYNNIKLQNQARIPLLLQDVFPSQFRPTDYTLGELTEIFGTDFLSWVGWNKLDYTTQTYQVDNEFTWNYSQSSNKIDGQPVLGNWRGLYQFFYGTVFPHTRPWELLGLTIRPSWWETTYGPAPYTSGNLVMWDDIEAGLVKDPVRPYLRPEFARPGLSKVIPVDSEGRLLAPLQSVVKNFDSTSFRRSWTVGDGAPTEYAWRSSSAWPFAVMRLLALTRPAKFFSLFADLDRYKYNQGLEQYLWEDRYRIEAQRMGPLYGNGQSRASYVNWIIDYNQQKGADSTNAIEQRLANIDVRLAWRLAGYSDKRYLKLFSERSTPESQNTSLLLPDESYQLLLYKNQAFEQITYSSLIVQSTDTGWAVFGYHPTKPYFEILVSRPAAGTREIAVGDSRVRVATQYSTSIARVPYGYVFTSKAAVADFILSYNALLEQQGFVFTQQENGYMVDWNQMVSEFLYWTNQGWISGSLINLNPGATRITVTRSGAVAESISPMTIENAVLNQNRQVLPITQLQINREDNTFEIVSLTQNTINFLTLRFTAYEHTVVLDNVSIFADLIYDNVTGARQSRIRAAGMVSADWDGTVNAPGFVLNQDNIQAWVSNQKYTKGDIVLFKDEYWAASTIIDPSEEFNYSQWVRSDYDQIQKGLLPNAATSSDQLAKAYSTYNANLQQDTDLFSYGLIGFRPRQYMEALNLDDVSQVNLYQQFLKTKGTSRSAEIFSLTDLGKEIAEYNIYENWAMLQSTYGANSNRSYVELMLEESKLVSDPALIQIINPGSGSLADQSVFVEDIWKSSGKITSPNILPTLTSAPTDIGLPSAGYVNLDDVSISLFSIDNFSRLSPFLNQIGVGTTLWVGKINAYDWAVYRVNAVPGDILQISNNLEGLALVTFSAPHNLDANEYLIVKYFNTALNGIYRVRSTVSPTSLLIEYVFSGSQNVINGKGVGLVLSSARVTQPSDIVKLPYSLELTSGARAWVDNYSNNRWAVLEKTDVFQLGQELVQPTFRDPGINFGASVAQGFRNLTSLVGAPGYNAESAAEAPGAVYIFVRTPDETYDDGGLIRLRTTDTVGLGTSMAVGNQEWAVIGAPDSNEQQGYALVVYKNPVGTVFEPRQLLIAPDGDTAPGRFSQTVSVSQDERWLYVGAPEINKVYAYAQIPAEPQTVRYTTDGFESIFNYSDFIAVTQPITQLTVSLAGRLLIPGVDYSANTTDIVLNSLPDAGRLLTVTRNFSMFLDQATYTNISPTGGSGTGLVVSVLNTRGVYAVTIEHPGIGYVVTDVLTVSGLLINSAGGATPAHDLVITVTQTRDTEVTGFTQSGRGVVDNNNFDIASTMATVSDIFSFSVYVNDVLYRPFIDYTYTNSGADEIVFLTIPSPGAAISVVSLTYFRHTVTLTVPSVTKTYVSHIGNLIILSDNNGIVPGMKVAGTGIADNQYVIATAGADQVIVSDDLTGSLSGNIVFALHQFGHSVSSTTDGRQIIVGSPGLNSPGQVFVYDRSVERFQITAATQREFTTIQSMTAPVSVVVNGELLVSTDLNPAGNFTVTGSNTVVVDYALSVGDIVEIETNNFVLVEQTEGNAPARGSKFGFTVDQCVNNCSLYVGAPYAREFKPEAGHVEFLQNQSRVYGTISSLNPNPVLTPGGRIRINNVMVECTGNTVAQLIVDINTAGIPNVMATATPDMLLTGDGTTTTFSVGNVYSQYREFRTRVLINGALVDSNDYSYNNTARTITFVTAPGKNSVITVVTGRITIAVKNLATSQALNRITVLPGTGLLFDTLAFDLYVWQQTIYSPVPQDYAHFGETVYISDNAITLAVGAPFGNMIRPTTIDNNTTLFDAGSTAIADTFVNSGAVYVYDFLPSTAPSVTNPGQWVFGQQIVDQSIQPLDKFGAAIDLTTGILLVGAPNNDRGDPGSNYGKVSQLLNPTQELAWKIIRLQQPTVNVDLLNSIFMYDRISNGVKQYFDFFDPLQGKLLGVVQQNLNYIGANDPAAYNQGVANNNGQRWGELQVGHMWWDTAKARFIDPNQDDITYASRRWGQLFPGSTVEVFQWVASSVLPAAYSGEGTVRSATSYVSTTVIDDQGFVNQIYYFWVKNSLSVPAGKTLGAATIARYIENPRASGIAYVAPINASTIAIYNGLEHVSSDDTIIHLEYDVVRNDDPVYVEYQLIPDRASGFLSTALYSKLLDSFCGSNATGAAVPDPFLSPSEKYGTQVRPRQSMFVNRFLALKNYLTRVNTILAQFPIAETRRSTLLDAAEPEPSISSGQWNMRVTNYQELLYQDLRIVPLGYTYLVANDESNSGRWTIYQVVQTDIIGNRNFALARVQNYDTREYWNTVDWYLAGYSPLTRVLLEVSNYAALSTLTVSVGSIVKVTANARGNWELYQRTDTDWLRVGLQKGTVQISELLWNYSAGKFGFDSEVFDSQQFDQEPVIETRFVLRAINEQLLVDDLLAERNSALLLMFNYILSEQQAPTWLVKTSLIDVDHTIRDLKPFQIYRADNQDFVIDYIKEVKPYHTQIREFNLIYRGSDEYLGDATDFDLPARFDLAKSLFVSPVLDNTGALSTTSSVPSTSPVWTTFPYNQWFNNYLLEIQAVEVINGGSDYTVPPQIEVLGTAVVPAVMQARINSEGQVSSIVVIDPGRGYSDTAVVKFVGGNGTGAQAVIRMGNQLIRQFSTTIKYDRTQYQSSVTDWTANVVYPNGSLVRFDNRVWAANSNTGIVVVSAVFNTEQWQLIPAGDLGGIDRTQGYYVPSQSEPGLDLALLISGLDYPGVQVKAPDFNQNTGYDVGNFDTVPFDNLSIGAEGFPTYDIELLDAIYESRFADVFLGTRAGDVNVVGGAFVDTYASHAPEELVPGITYDTLDMRVFTTPGADWSNFGFTWQEAATSFEFSASQPTVSVAGLLEYPIAAQVWNRTTQRILTPGVDYVVSWPALTVTVTAAASDGNIIQVSMYSMGGGNQLYTNSYVNPGTGVVIPMQSQLIEQVAVFVNGVPSTDYVFEAENLTSTRITFGNDYTSNTRVTLTAMGQSPRGAGQSWSTPLTQSIVSAGLMTQTLTNSMSGTNAIAAMVSVNGQRARPAAVAEYFPDRITQTFDIPVPSDVNIAEIQDSDVSVYVDNLKLALGTDYVVDPVDGSSLVRTVTLAVAPPVEDYEYEIYVACDTKAQYTITGSTLSFVAGSGLVPQTGDAITVVSFNDTSEQRILNQVFAGPSESGITVSEGFDTRGFDIGLITGESGSFDYADGVVIKTNTFLVSERRIVDTNDLTVTLDGRYLFPNQDWIVQDEFFVLILGPAINANQVVVITSIAPNEVPDATGFRVFQDMRGVQTTFRITSDTTVLLTQPLLSTQDVIHVTDASRLDLPDLSLAIFGQITINGERITYRHRDLVNNTVSGLRRGVFGTGAADHDMESTVFVIGLSTVLPAEYQDQINISNFLGNGADTTFAALGIVINDATDDSSAVFDADRAVMVYIGGTLQTNGYSVSSVDPVTVVFDTAPPAGHQVSIRVKQGLNWYQPGTNTAGNGRSLQTTDTFAARFIRGAA